MISQPFVGSWIQELFLYLDDIVYNFVMIFVVVVPIYVYAIMYHIPNQYLLQNHRIIINILMYVVPYYIILSI